MAAVGVSHGGRAARMVALLEWPGWRARLTGRALLARWGWLAWLNGQGWLSGRMVSLLRALLALFALLALPGALARRALHARPHGRALQTMPIARMWLARQKETR